MESKELQEIKARAERIKKLLGNGSDALHLIEDDLPELVAEVEWLKTELGQAGNCPHGGLYKDRTCVECFGDGTEDAGVQRMRHSDMASWREMPAP